jgi:hypothetical protein
LKSVEDVKYSNPSEYKKKQQILEKAKEKLSDEVDRINNRISKVK